jgi:hypothetical protein
MAEALEVQIADAVKDEINSGSWTQTVNAERHWLPVFEPADCAELRVTVCPMTLDQTRVARAKLQREYGVAIHLIQMVEVADRDALKAKIDELTRFAEELHDHFGDAHRLSGLTDWMSFASERRDIYDLERLYDQHTWETLIIVTVRGWHP